MTARDARATKARLVAAATAEFARHGIAGARVDRIAAEARSNKAQIYHYFGSKEGLFDAVFAHVVETVLAEAPLDASNLPGYAGLLFDGYRRHPEVARLATWYRLERGHTTHLHPDVLAGNAGKVAAIAAAQRAGTVSDAFPPEVVLGLVMHLAALWTSQTPEYDYLTHGLGPRQRREIVTEAVRALVSPANAYPAH